MVKKRPAACGWAWAASVAVLALGGCAGETYPASPGDPDKPARACRAVDEATPLAMSPADRAACERTMRGWYSETWYTRPDPADRHTGETQLEYLRAKALECRGAADAYRVTGKERRPLGAPRVLACVLDERERRLRAAAQQLEIRPGPDAGGVDVEPGAALAEQPGRHPRPVQPRRACRAFERELRRQHLADHHRPRIAQMARPGDLQRTVVAVPGFARATPRHGDRPGLEVDMGEVGRAASELLPLAQRPAAVGEKGRLAEPARGVQHRQTTIQERTASLHLRTLDVVLDPRRVTICGIRRQ